MDPFHQKEESLLELAIILGRQSDFQESLRIVSQRMCDMFEAEAASIVMVNPRTQDTLKTVVKEGRDANVRRYQFAQTNIIGWTRHHKRPLLAQDLQKFREDLYYRLHVYPVHIPPLAGRKTDIQLLADHILEKFAQQQGKQVKTIDKKLQAFLSERPWSGNVRELENLIERLVTLCAPDATALTYDALPSDLRAQTHSSTAIIHDQNTEKSLDEKVAAYEKQLILHALKKHNWRQSQAARELKIIVQTLRYKIKKLAIVAPEDETVNEPFSRRKTVK